MSPEMLGWAIDVVIAIAVIVYLYLGVSLLNQVWWAFGEPPKTKWKYRLYQMKLLSIIVGYPIWTIYLGIRNLLQKNERT